MTVIGYLTTILCCQLVGEAFVTFFAIPVPGPVVGMAVLFAGLMIKGHVPDNLATVGDTLLNNLSLLFVPAGVGVMLHLTLLADDWLPISIALVVSTLLTIAVTGGMMVLLNRPTKTDDEVSS